MYLGRSLDCFRHVWNASSLFHSSMIFCSSAGKSMVSGTGLTMATSDSQAPGTRGHTSVYYVRTQLSRILLECRALIRILIECREQFVRILRISISACVFTAIMTSTCHTHTQCYMCQSVICSPHLPAVYSLALERPQCPALHTQPVR